MGRCIEKIQQAGTSAIWSKTHITNDAHIPACRKNLVRRILLLSSPSIFFFLSFFSSSFLSFFQFFFACAPEGNKRNAALSFFFLNFIFLQLPPILRTVLFLYPSIGREYIYISVCVARWLIGWLGCVPRHFLLPLSVESFFSLRDMMDDDIF